MKERLNFYTTRELKTETKQIFDATVADGLSVITNNGKPSKILVDIGTTDVEKLVRSIRQARAMLAVNEMREIAKKNGYMTEKEIEAEIKQARKENNQA